MFDEQLQVNYQNIDRMLFIVIYKEQTLRYHKRTCAHTSEQ